MIIYNLVPDPRFKNRSWFALNSAVTPIPEHDAVNVSNTNGDTDSFMQFDLPDVSQYRGVNMTFACSLTAIDGGATECVNGLLFVWANNWSAGIGWRNGGGRAEKSAIHTAERRHRTPFAIVCAA